MPDRLPLQLTPKERLEHLAAVLARGIRRYMRNWRTSAAHPRDLPHGGLPLPVSPGSKKPPEFSPRGLELSENPRLPVS